MRRLTVQFVTCTGYFKLKGIVLCIHYASFTWNIMNGMRLQTLQISHLTVVTLTASPNPALKRGFVTFVYSFCGRLFINFFSASSSILKLSGKLQYNCLCALHLLITLKFFFCISYYIVGMYKFISPAHKCSTL